MAALVILRDKAIKPLRPSLRAQNPTPLDANYDTIRTDMFGVFDELGVAV
jgi:hypothetical protein